MVLFAHLTVNVWSFWWFKYFFLLLTSSNGLVDSPAVKPVNYLPCMRMHVLLLPSPHFMSDSSNSNAATDGKKTGNGLGAAL